MLREFRAQGVEFSAAPGCRDEGLRFRVWGLGFRV